MEARVADPSGVNRTTGTLPPFMNLGVRTETSLFERDTIEPAIPPKVTEVVALRLPPEIVTVVPPVAVPTTGVAEVTMGSRA